MASQPEPELHTELEDPISDEPTGHEQLDDVSITAKMYLTQHKGKALAKALKNGVRDVRVLSALMKNQAVHRRVPAVLSLYVGDAKVLSRLIEAGANVRFDDDALLVFAANEGVEESVDLLLSSGGCAPSSKALAVAVAKKHIDVVERLISAGSEMTDRLWKSVVKRADESEEGLDILQLLARQASEKQVQSAIKLWMISENVNSIAALVTMVWALSPKTAADAVQILCMSSNSHIFIRLIRSLIQKGIKPANYDDIKENGEPAVVKLLSRYR